jgi:23S rRNA (adenine2503-C2)-methyltransferase
LTEAVGLLHPKPGKGDFHGGAVFRDLYQKAVFDPASSPAFAANPGFAETVRAHFHFVLPELIDRVGDGVTYKFLLRLRDGLVSESVVIPMRHYKALCVSSQVGCKMGCGFCETAQMGFLRHLTPGEIVAQVMVARHLLQEPIENIVFMGMGEPLDNLDSVLAAIRILSDQRGLSISQSNITVSTVGHVPALKRLAELARLPKEEGFPHLRLAVSLNAPNDEIRSRIMPVNRQWNLAELREVLMSYPLLRRGDFIFFEYVLLPGVNDSPEDALQVAEYLRGLKSCVNLIPYNPRKDSPFAKPTTDSVKRFYLDLMNAGQYCRIRGTKGQDVMAACGQLGMRELSRRRKAEHAIAV